mgnify:CR=1 FL=1
MQESMLLVSLYVTRMESYGGHFRSAMRAEVCQMCRLTGWDGAVFVASGASWVLLVLCLLWLKYDSKMSRKLQSPDWLGCLCLCGPIHAGYRASVSDRGHSSRKVQNL